MRARFVAALLLAFAPVFVAAPAEADDLFVWENSPIGVYLPEGVTFTTVHGWYGSPDDPSCGVDVSDVLTALAVGQNSFQVDANNSVFGDPCGGVYKVLRITGVEANWQQPILLDPTPVAEPPVEPTTSPSPEPTQMPQVTAEPTPVATASPLPEPSATPSPEPSIPSSLPSVDVVDTIVPVMPAPVEPVVTPPVIVPQPQPQPLPFPTAPEPPKVEPTPEPAPTVEPEPAPTVEPAPEPVPVASTPPVAAPPAPVAVIAPPPPVEPSPPPVAVVAELAKQDPKTLTDTQVALITQVAVATLATEPQGSPAYNAALDQLMVVAQADDSEVPTELAAIPLLGNAAVAVLDAFNQLGNFGSDISPKVRKQAKKEAIATIAVGTATTASAVAASGSVGYRRKVT